MLQLNLQLHSLCLTEKIKHKCIRNVCPIILCMCELNVLERVFMCLGEGYMFIVINVTDVRKWLFLQDNKDLTNPLTN